MSTEQQTNGRDQSRVVRIQRDSDHPPIARDRPPAIAKWIREHTLMIASVVGIVGAGAAAHYTGLAGKADVSQMESMDERMRAVEKESSESVVHLKYIREAVDEIKDAVK